MTDKMVTHPAEGVYLSKFMAGIAAGLITTAGIAAFSNLWYLNRKAIEFDGHIAFTASPNSTLPGALSRSEWALERQLIMQQLKVINDKLDALATERSNERTP